MTTLAGWVLMSQLMTMPMRSSRRLMATAGPTPAGAAVGTRWRCCRGCRCPMTHPPIWHACCSTQTPSSCEPRGSCWCCCPSCGCPAALPHTSCTPMLSASPTFAAPPGPAPTHLPAHPPAWHRDLWEEALGHITYMSPSHSQPWSVHGNLHADVDAAGVPRSDQQPRVVVSRGGRPAACPGGPLRAHCTCVTWQPAGRLQALRTSFQLHCS